MLIDPSTSALNLPKYPLGGLKFGGLKTLPMFLHLFVISLPSLTVNEYISPGFKPVRDTKTSAFYPFLEPKNSSDPSMSSGTKF